MTGLFNVELSIISYLRSESPSPPAINSLGSHALEKNVMAVEHTYLHDEEKRNEYLMKVLSMLNW